MRNLASTIFVLIFWKILLAQSTLISPAQFNVLLNDTTIQKLDVRSGVEYELIGHIPDFVQMNVLDKNFTTRVKQELDPSKPILVTCFSGHRSVDAVKILSGLGFTTIYELEGGLINWMQKGYKLE